MGQKTFPALPKASPTTLIFWCGDPRFQEAVHRLIWEDLGLHYGEYLPITVLGGVASFSEGLSLPKEFKYVKEAAEFCLDHFKSIHRVVLINHEDCAKYKALHERLGSLFLRGTKDMPERQRNDLKKVCDVLAALATRNLEIHRYYLKYSNPERTLVTFERI